MNTVIYYLGLSLFLTHELDAVRRGEWKLLYVLQSLPDAAAFSWFAAMHVPLFFVVLWFSQHSNDRLRLRFRLVVALSLVIHALLHFRLSDDPLYEFSGWLSNALIYGAGFMGATYGLLAMQEKGIPRA